MTQPAQPPAADETKMSLQHLQAELARIELLVRREVLRWQLAGQDPGDGFRGLHISAEEASQLFDRPFGASWGQTVDLPAGGAQAFTAAQSEAEQRLQAAVEQAGRLGQTPRLLQLAGTFGLDRLDLDILLVCLAPALDQRYERLYSFLQDDVTRRRPRINLVLDLLAPEGPDRLLMLSRFGDDAPLFRYHLLARDGGADSGSLPLLGQILQVDDAVVTWLLGGCQVHADLRPHAQVRWPQENGSSALLAGSDRLDTLRSCLAPGLAEEGQWPVFAFYGPDQIGQRAAADTLAAWLARPLLVVDLEPILSGGTSPSQAVWLALRDARLSGAIAYLTGWDACLAENHEPGDKAPPPISSEVLARLCAHVGCVILASQRAWLPRGFSRERRFVHVEFSVPGYSQRLALWEHFLAGQICDKANAPASVPPAKLDLATLAGQFLLTPAQIRDAVASAHDLAFLAGRHVTGEDLLLSARAHSNPQLSRLARKIEPRYGWADLVLPSDQLELLREIVATVQGRPLVLEEWGLGRKLASSSGVTVLFSGDPGTGKTMAAEIMAAELGLDLYKIDLSTIVSKYIGETEKNLERIFGEAQSSNAILFFDEADAIFGKRSEVKDAHDRYANIEISYLLQKMEMYDGVTILATNLRANLDEAFTRRLQFAVDFPFPDEEYRRRIWETLFPPDVPREPDLDLGLLARRFKLAGGNIRNILVSAAYLAAADGKAVTMAHLLHGTRRELQKMGRLVKENDMAVN